MRETKYNRLKLNDTKFVWEYAFYDGYFGRGVMDWAVVDEMPVSEIGIPQNDIKKFNGETSTKFNLVTHDGIFHPDEVVAIALLDVAGFDFEISRTRDKSIINDADLVIDVGMKYDRNAGRFDHHHFKDGDYHYGKSSAGIVANWLYASMAPELETFIASVDARDTRMGKIDEKYEEILEAISGLNDIDPKSDNQLENFYWAVRNVGYYIDYKFFKRGEYKTEQIIDRAKENKEKSEKEFEKRRDKAVVWGGLILSEKGFYPEWREDVGSRLFVYMDGDDVKIMADTDHTKILRLVNRDGFVHQGGFFATFNAKGTDGSFSIEVESGGEKSVIVFDKGWPW